MENASSASPGAPVRDHLAREHRLDADVVGDRGEDRGVLGEVDRRPRRPRPRGGVAQVGDRVHRVGRRAAVAEREQLARRASKQRAQRRGRGGERRRRPRRASASRSAADLAGLGQHRAAHVGEHGVEVVLGLGRGRDRGSSTRPRRGAPGVAAREQPAVLEEDVHELPQHVVGRLGQLLARRTGRRGGTQLPLRADRPRTPIVRQPAARAAAATARRVAERHHDVVRPRQQRDVGRRPTRRAPAARACRRSPGGRTRRRRGARRSGPPATRRRRAAARRARSARPSRGTAARAARASRGEEALAAGDRARRSPRRALIAAACRRPVRQRRQPVAQRVDALARARAHAHARDARVHRVEVVDEAVHVEVDVRRAGRSC